MKKEIIKFRCTRIDKKRLKIRAKRAGLTVSEFCRRAALDVKIKERFSDEQIVFYKTLVRYHNNFRSVANLYKNKSPMFSKELENLALEIKERLQDFKQ